MHTVHNALSDLHFGFWKNDIHDATFDDFMHSGESGSGLLMHGDLVAFGSLQSKEAGNDEAQVHSNLLNLCSSVRTHFPCWRLQKGFHIDFGLGPTFSLFKDGLCKSSQMAQSKAQDK